MISMYLNFLLVLVVCDFIEPLIFHKRNRQKIEATCINEHPMRTYLNAVVVNLFVTLPFALVGFVFIFLLFAFV